MRAPSDNFRQCDRCRQHRHGEHAVIIDEGWEPICLTVCDNCYSDLCSDARSRGVPVTVYDFKKDRE